MQAPSSKKELTSFHDMANYLNQFIPAMCDLFSNLRNLLKKGVLSNGHIVIRMISRN